MQIATILTQIKFLRKSQLLHASTTHSLRIATPFTQKIKHRNQHTRSSVKVSANMFSNLKNNLQKSGPPFSTTSPRAQVSFLDNAPSWDELLNTVAKLENELGIQSSPDLDNGPPSPAALRRTFGFQGEPRIKLYRDHATWCPYCHKVVLQLEEKKIPYVIEKINMRCYGDKPREFLAKVPSGLLPVLEIDGQIITESAVIQNLLEELYPEPALLPAEGTPERTRASSLMRLERRLFSDWLQWLCNAWGNDGNKAAFESTMDTVDRELSVTKGPYFLTEFSLVDIVFAPFLERIAASILYYKGFYVRGKGRWPNVDRWFEAMETREAYLAFQSDYYTHCHDLPPQLGGCSSIPEAAPYAAAIDGTDGVSWHLPLPPLSSTSLEAYSPGEDPVRDRVRAAAKLIRNHEAVTKFALRGVGKPGPRPVSAPLSDPTAIPDMQYFPEVDAALRHVAAALLHPGGAERGKNISITTAGSEGKEQGSEQQWMSGNPVVPSLEYLRDRVGVPRDYDLPAARQLRAHLNWMIDQC